MNAIEPADNTIVWQKGEVFLHRADGKMVDCLLRMVGTGKCPDTGQPRIVSQYVFPERLPKHWGGPSGKRRIYSRVGDLLDPRLFGFKPNVNAFRKAFDDKGLWAAQSAAEAWCRKWGISVGPNDRYRIRGLLVGNYDIAKWHNLTKAEQDACDGRMTGDAREGPVFVTITASAVARLPKELA